MKGICPNCHTEIDETEVSQMHPDLCSVNEQGAAGEKIMCPACAELN